MKELIINNIYKIEQWGINVKKPFLYFVSGFIVFFISGIFHFYFLKLFPSENSFYIHLSTIITLVLIIAFIFPLREKLDSYF
ncbi:MAG: hypothetical protein KDK36_05685, partial [Leptospiraceae bacterium]|nr:hypothetical protein [Leptospiraceae bacterium]